MTPETYKKYYDAMKGCCTLQVPFTPKDGLDRVHGLCGCDGRHDCDCISVVNKVHPEMWYEHNSRGTRNE